LFVFSYEIGYAPKADAEDVTYIDDEFDDDFTEHDPPSQVSNVSILVLFSTKACK